MLNYAPPYSIALVGILAVGIPYLIWKIPGVSRWIPLSVTQILVGLMLGPSLLGAVIGPANHSFFFGGNNLIGIQAVAAVAVILFAFLAGVGTDRDSVLKSAGMTLVTGLVSLLAPLAIGALVALAVVAAFPTAKAPEASALIYALGFGLVMSITALPVLAAILGEFRVMSKSISSVALAGAGVGNVFIWVGLGIVLVLNNPAGGNIGASILVALGGAVALIAVGFAGRAFFNRITVGPGSLGTILCGGMVYACACGLIGHATNLHFILGAFVGGLLVPEHVRKPLLDLLERPVNIALVPFFFAVAGLATVFRAGDPSLFVVTIAGLLVAVLAKIVPTAIAARACGERASFGATLGIMHMTKGLVGVALANALFVGKVFGPSTYTAMIIVCLVTTAATAPALVLAKKRSPEIDELLTPDDEKPTAVAKAA